MSADTGSHADAAVGTAIGAALGGAGATLAEVLRRFGPAWRAGHAVSTQQLRVWRAIQDCRTSALGGHLQQCDTCGVQQRLYNSCRFPPLPDLQDLPKQGPQARDGWRRARLAELLPVPYCH